MASGIPEHPFLHESRAFAYAGRLPVEDGGYVEYYDNRLLCDLDYAAVPVEEQLRSVQHRPDICKKGTHFPIIVIDSDRILGYANDGGVVLDYPRSVFERMQ